MNRMSTAAGVIVLIVVLSDLALWGGHVAWRTRAVRELEPVREQIDRLRVQLDQDDAWVERRERLMQEYAQHRDLAARLAARGRRAQAYRMLVAIYNQRVTEVYRRFYLAPVPAPEPPVIEVGR